MEYGKNEFKRLIKKPLMPYKFTPHVEGFQGVVSRGVDLRQALDVTLRSFGAIDVRLVLAETHQLPRDPSASLILDRVHGALNSLPQELFNVVGVSRVQTNSNRQDISSRTLKTLFEEHSQKKKNAKDGLTAKTSFHIEAKASRLSVSMSLAGEQPLWQRGYKKILKATAPLPECVAACCVGTAISSLGDFTGHNVSVINPMAGSGTLGFEAILNFSGGHVHTSTLELASAAFGVPQKTLSFLERKLKPRPEPGEAEAGERLRLAMSDSNSDVIGILSENVAHFSRLVSAEGSVCPPVKLDFLKAPITSFLVESTTWSQPERPSSLLLLLNPPHGVRLGKETHMEGFYGAIGRQAGMLCREWRMNAVSPGKFAGVCICPDSATWNAFQRAMTHSVGEARMSFVTTNFNLAGRHMRCLAFSTP